MQSGDNKVIIMAPVVRGRKGEYRKELEDFKSRATCACVWTASTIPLTKKSFLTKRKHDISVTIDRIAVKEGSERRLTDSVEAALKLANGLVVVENAKRRRFTARNTVVPIATSASKNWNPDCFLSTIRTGHVPNAADWASATKST